MCTSSEFLYSVRGIDRFERYFFALKQSVAINFLQFGSIELLRSKFVLSYI